MADFTTFSLRGRALKLDTAADLEPHLSPLLSNPATITAIHLEGNTLGVPACERLADIIPTLSNLAHANLADIFTGRLLAEIPPALDALLTALLKCPQLRTVNLNDNAFGLNTVEPLRPFLSKHTPLQHLHLNNNGLGPAAGSLVAEALASLADKKAQARKDDPSKEIPNLETIVCGRNRLETGSMAAWVKAYQAHTHIQTVKMVQNGIRQEGVAMLLSQGLSHCKELRVLDLQDNTFTALASRSLADVVPGWSELKELGVSDCLLSARGGKMLAEALGKGGCVKLEVLRCQFDEIDAKGVGMLADDVEGKSLPRLRRVELNGNKFSEEDAGIERLQAVLSKRKEEHADEYPDVDEDDEDAWGVDELDELEEDSDEEKDDGDVDDEEEGEKLVKDDQAAENEPVAQKKDGDVDALADALGKAEIK